MPSSTHQRPLLLLLLALTLIIGAGWYLSLEQRAGPAQPAAQGKLDEEQQAAIQSELSLPDSPPDEQRSPAGERPRVPTHPAEEARPAPPGRAKLLSVRGRTLDVKGQPVAFVELVYQGHPEEGVRSDAAGYFELELPESRYGETLCASGVGYASVVGCRLGAASVKALQYVVVAPALEIAGRVRDASGGALPGVSVVVERWNIMTSSFPYPLDQGVSAARQTETDAQGGFSFKALPSLEDGRLNFSLAGYQELAQPVPSFDRSDWNLVLEKNAEARLIRGRVLLPDRTPAVDARVEFDGQSVRTDAWGSFGLAPGPGYADYAQDTPPIALAAALQPYGPAVIEDCSALLASMRPELPEDLELVLAEKPLELRGRVVDAEGLPLAGWSVNLRGGLLLTNDSMPAPSAESLAGESSVSTDDAGNFVLGGLLDREYKLWAYDHKSLRSIEPGKTFRAGGQPVLLVSSAEEYYAELRGIVVGADGSPIPGAGVQGNLVIERSASGFMSISSPSLSTDAEGRFVFQNLGKHEVSLSVFGESMIPRRFEIEEHMDPLNLRLVAHRRCHFRLFIAGVGAELQSIRFEDAEGEELQIYSFQSNGWRSSTVSSIDPQDPGVLAVSETAALLLVGTEDPVRHFIQVIPGQVTELRVQQ